MNALTYTPEKIARHDVPTSRSSSKGCRRISRSVLTGSVKSLDRILRNTRESSRHFSKRVSSTRGQGKEARYGAWQSRQRRHDRPAFTPCRVPQNFETRSLCAGTPSVASELQTVRVLRPDTTGITKDVHRLVERWLRVAKRLLVGLADEADCTIWDQGLFELSAGTLDTLVTEAPKFDFAILVLTADDVTTNRSQTKSAPHDNVLVELGLFLGALGAKRTFIVLDQDGDLGLPSDLAGVTLAGYRVACGDANLQATLGPTCTKIEDAMKKKGLKP